MIYEITSAEEGGSPQDVVLTIHYWYEESEEENPSSPQRSPDFIEDHLIIGIPDPDPVPLRTPLGRFVALDGSPFPEWDHDEEGELFYIDPHDVADQIQWKVYDDERRESLISSPVDDHAQEVAIRRPKGKDVFSDNYRPSPIRARRTTSNAKRIAAGLVGRTKVI